LSLGYVLKLQEKLERFAHVLLQGFSFYLVEINTNYQKQELIQSYFTSFFRQHNAYDMFVHSSGDISPRLDYFCLKT